MDINELGLIDPAFRNIEQYCREQIEKYLEALPEQEKADMLIVIVKPVIPATIEEVHNHINWRIELYDPQTPTEEEELKSELIECCRFYGITIDENLPLRQFQNDMRSELQKLSNEKLLEIGVFGIELTQEDIERNRELVISGYIQHIQQAAYDQALVQLGQIDRISKDSNYSFVADKFPLLVNMVKENLLNRNYLN